jgi:glutamate N-acetyltransferase/amino-acid N-acetyltransferase
MVASDGEGASRFITILVEQARNEHEARQIARTVATSPLVKTALCGGDPNWGRVLAAVGRAGVPIDPGRVDIYFGDSRVCRNGERESFNESAVKDILGKKQISIRILLHAGTSAVTFWTCDLTEGYIRINAHYRT